MKNWTHLGFPQTLVQREERENGQSTSKILLSMLLSFFSFCFATFPQELGTAMRGF